MHQRPGCSSLSTGSLVGRLAETTGRAGGRGRVDT